MDNQKIAVIYTRVSTEEQAKEGLSIESQVLACERKAKEDECIIFKIIKDEGKSGGSLKRPGMQELIQLTVGKKMNFVYTVHSDRLARNTYDYLNLVDLFKKNGVQIKFINQANFEEDNASSTLIGTVMASVNQFQRDITAEKVKATMIEKANAGYYPALAPIGYKNVSHPNASERFARKTVEIDETVAPHVKEVFRLYGTGNYNVMDITAILHERGVRTNKGKKLHHSKIYIMLKNPFYVGEFRWGEVHVKNAKHQALIERELFDRVQSILKSHNKHTCRKRKFQWLLNGFMRCYKHGCRYTAEWHLGKMISYYHCPKGGCGKYIRTEKLEEMVSEKFKTLEFSEGFINDVIEKLKIIFYDRRESYESKRQDLVNQRKKYEIKMRVAEEKLLSKTLSDKDFKRIREENNIEIESLDRRIMQIKKEKDIDIDVAQQVIGLTKNIYQTYMEASPQLKRLLLGFFWEKFEITDGLIITSIPSTLFAELISLEQAFLKNEKPEETNVSNGIISFQYRCAQ